MHALSLTEELKEQVIFRFTENTPRIDKCLKQLTEEEVWQKPNSNTNSIGNLILHLCGNITQYVITSFSEEKDRRQRDLEFSITKGMTSTELFAKLTEVVTRSVEIIRNLKEKELLEIKNVQCYEMSGIACIVHVVEHYSYHTGQIAFWTKLLKDKDLEFYAGVNLNQTSE